MKTARDEGILKLSLIHKLALFLPSLSICSRSLLEEECWSMFFLISLWIKALPKTCQSKHQQHVNSPLKVSLGIHDSTNTTGTET